jgi:predicted ArsR family transcriptional regulator
MVLVAVFRRRRLTAPGPQAGRAWQALATLGEPRRRDVYDVVARADAPVTRDHVSEALGMSRSLVAFHLDKLADTGLLDVSFARSPGRPAGPGGGRPSKRYQVSDLDLGISVPPRRYDVVGRILARTLGAGGRHGDPAAAAWDVAHDEGRRLAELSLDAGGRHSAAADQVEQVVAEFGYTPVRDGSCIRLRNCPFLAVADAMPDTVCTVNHGFLAGVIDGLGAGGGMTARRVDGRADGCCVDIDLSPN